jgi:hypothetical protein
MGGAENRKYYVPNLFNQFQPSAPPREPTPRNPLSPHVTSAQELPESAYVYFPWLRAAGLAVAVVSAIHTVQLKQDEELLHSESLETKQRDLQDTIFNSFRT